MVTNWEFEWYNNNRSNSYTENGNLHIRPTLLADEAGEEFLYSGSLDINGGSPYETCTNPQWYGCSRTGTEESALNPIKSARIRTVDSFSFKYGKIEVRAKLPAGDWLWPAIWMLPRYMQYSGWPSSGEIDIMESRGNRQLVNADGVNVGSQQVGSTLHFGPSYNYNRYQFAHFDKNNDAGYDTDFYRYQMEWAPDHITFSIEDEVIGTVTPPEGGFWELGQLVDSGQDNPWKRSSNLRMAPFDQEFYIVLNVAVGGVAYFPDDATNPGGKPWLNDSPHASTDFWQGRDQWLPTWDMDSDQSHLQVDYVRVWAL
ncbi:hypothetical protein NQ315_012363 [Exocentrus adspersus]|uniref:GH16 domain-containing protein n=1 Tax=Exocentrus adspersus TaxID=1586481 RepID=A0AAV8VBS0_9CUCU|nr:hypothetical protein NQ315_012363 [Exocentrus adspersus]